MSDDIRVGTSLAKHVGKAPMDEGDLRRLNAAVWHKHGAGVVYPARITDEWLRQALVNHFEKQFGKRQEVKGGQSK